ncbi:MAG: hypothetical protein ACOCTH_01730 [Halodesulfurarchaeum sp.]
MRNFYIELDDLIQQAFREGREVDLVQAEEYGYHIEIDGVPITDGGTGDGLPREIFSWPVEGWTRTPEAEEKVEELIRGYRVYRRDLENEDIETSSHSASEGVGDGS